MAVKRPRAYWPLTVDSTNNAFQVRESGGGYTAKTLTSATYVSPEALADDLVTEINEVLGAPDVTYSIDSTTGKLTLTRTSGNWDIDFSVANSCGDLLGFGTETRTDDTEHVATDQFKNAWWAPASVSFDSPGSIVRHMGGSVSLNDKVQIVVWNSGTRRRIELAYLDAHKTYKSKEGSGQKYQAIQRLFEDGYAKFRWWPDATVTGTYDDLALEPKAAENFRPRRQFQTVERYSLILEAAIYVA